MRAAAGRWSRGWGCALVLVWGLAGAAHGSVQSELAFHRGVLAYGDENWVAARASFEKVLAENPQDTAALHYLGLIAQAQEDYPGAIDAYQKALAIAPDDPDLLFDLGSAQLESGRDVDARASFERVVAAQPDRARAHLFLGIAQYRLGDYEEAVPHFDRAIAIDPQLKLHARYYTGLAEVRRGDLGTAAGAFDDVTDASPAHPLSRSAGSLRDQVTADSAEARRWNLALTAGLEYDSNPLVAGKGLVRKDDGRGVYRVRGSLRLYENDWASLDAGYDAFFSTHFDQTRVDLMTHVGWASGSVQLEPVRFSLRYDYAYTQISISKKFRGLHRVTPSALVSEGEWGVVQTFFQYQHLDYYPSLLTAALDRDGDEYAVGVNQFIFLPAPLQYLRIGALGDFLDTEGSEFDYDAWEVNAGVGAGLPFGVQLTLLYRFIQRDYRNSSIFRREGVFGFTRRDEDIHRLTAEAAIPIGEHWEISAAGSFNFHDADVRIYDHNRHIAGSYLTYRF